jgi:hypothetical protein
VGFLDKVKEQAEVVARKAEEVGRVGQEKLQDAMSKRKADTVLRDLGAAVYAEKTGRATPETAADVERLVSELRTLEESGTQIDPPS